MATSVPVSCPWTFFTHCATKGKEVRSLKEIFWIHLLLWTFLTFTDDHVLAAHALTPWYEAISKQIYLSTIYWSI